jgi:signal transduction histidine kinase
MKLNVYSLRFKLMLASTVVEALMLSYLLLNTMRLIDQSMLASTEAALKQTVPMLNVATSRYLVEGDYAALQDNLNEIVSDVNQGVVYVVVSDTGKRVVARAGVADPASLPAPSQNLDDALSGAVLHIERPLSLAGQRVGVLRFGLSTQIIAQAKASVFKQSSLIALAEIALTFVLLSGLGFWLTRNLLSFVKTSRAIADGNYALRLPERGRDEVADLAANFNRMSIAVERQVGELRASEQRFRDLNEQLELRVEERTEALREAVVQLAESEKLASLGRVVAGVAHELNTPVGNIVLMSSALDDRVDLLIEALQSHGVTRSALLQGLTEFRNANQIILRSAQRSAALIESFKRVAVDQTSHRRRHFDLREVVDDILNTMATIMRHAQVTVELRVPAGIEMDAQPGYLEQIFNNLIMNSIRHGFRDKQGGHIVINASNADEWVTIDYQDDGHGIAKDLQHKVFEPFYTSQLGQGGSGLGMFIVHNLIHGAFGGHHELHSEPEQGVRFVFTVLAVAPE